MIESIFKGMYPYFSIFAFLIIICRIAAKRWTKAETLLLLCLVLHTVGQILQVVAGDGKWDIPRRYFLPASPLLFVWTAYGVYGMIRRYRQTFCTYKRYWVAIAVLLGMLLLYDGFAPTLKAMYSKRKRGEAALAAAAVAVIRADYQGPLKEKVPVHKLIYHSPYLPVVWCEFPVIGLLAGGRAEPSPFEDKPDYWVLRSGELPPPEAVRLMEINAQGFIYVLYKRAPIQ